MQLGNEKETFMMGFMKGMELVMLKIVSFYLLLEILFLRKKISINNFSGLCPDGRTFDEHYTIWEIVSKNHLYEGFIVFIFSWKKIVFQIGIYIFSDHL